MDVFQGSFKTTPYDCRYFAALYLLLRALNIVLQGILQDTLYYPFFSLIFFITSLIVCFMKPRRYFRHNVIDSLLLAVATVSSLIFTINVVIPYIDPILSPDGNVAIIVDCLILLLPAMYWMILVVYFVTPKRVLTYFCRRCHSVRCWKCCQAEEMDFEEGNEQTPLLSVH